MKLDATRPTDRRLALVYRIGGGLTGVVLIAFGVLGLLDRLAFFDTQGTIAGLSTNGALSFISIAVGSLLLGGAVVGGTFASTLNIAVGAAFVASGLVNLYLMGTGYNPLAFAMPNVIFSFVVGMMVMTFGMYGRVSGGLPHDNPFWRHRHRAEAQGADPGARIPSTAH